MSYMDIFRSQKEQGEYINAFCKNNKISKEQEKILCRIQRAATFKCSVYLTTLPQEITDCAIETQKRYREGKNYEKGDKKLLKLVKKYWNKNGIAISFEKNTIPPKSFPLDTPKVFEG